MKLDDKDIIRRALDLKLSMLDLDIPADIIEKMVDSVLQIPGVVEDLKKKITLIEKKLDELEAETRDSMPDLDERKGNFRKDIFKYFEILKKKYSKKK